MIFHFENVSFSSISSCGTVSIVRDCYNSCFLCTPFILTSLPSALKILLVSDLGFVLFFKTAQIFPYFLYRFLVWSLQISPIIFFDALSNLFHFCFVSSVQSCHALFFLFIAPLILLFHHGVSLNFFLPDFLWLFHFHFLCVIFG